MTHPTQSLLDKTAMFTPSEITSSGTGIFRVLVKIIATRRAYGREECLVKPVKGAGRAWVRLTSLEFRGSAKKVLAPLIAELVEPPVPEI